MRERIQHKFYELSYYAELVISVIIYIIISIGIAKIIIDLFNPDMSWYNENALNYFLNRALLLAVATEFVKMLCRHTPGSVIEVLLFATARQMVVEHYTPVETLISVVAIVCLLAARRFLLDNSSSRKQSKGSKDNIDGSDTADNENNADNTKKGVNFL